MNTTTQRLSLAHVFRILSAPATCAYGIGNTHRGWRWAWA
jgi:hypothetical protein